MDSFGDSCLMPTYMSSWDITVSTLMARQVARLSQHVPTWEDLLPPSAAFCVHDGNTYEMEAGFHTESGLKIRHICHHWDPLTGMDTSWAMLYTRETSWL